MSVIKDRTSRGRVLVAILSRDGKRVNCNALECATVPVSAGLRMRDGGAEMVRFE